MKVKVPGSRFCPLCNREFHPPSSEWLYKAKIDGKLMYLCSWACYRKATKGENEDEGLQKGKR